MADLKLKGVRKTFGALTVIHGVDLEVHDGEFIVFVGPSGCGKSTLLRLIAGLEEASSGEVVIDGRDVTSTPASDRGLAMVFQSYALYPHMSVRKNMAFALENMRLPAKEIDARVDKAAEMLRLGPYLERRPKALSGGQRQRVAIGRAIVRNPKIFLFDEPLSNLDAELRVATRKELAALHTRLGGTMIYVTHDQVEAMTLADRIVVLQAGRICQVGPPLELYERPRNAFVAGFIGSPRMNLLPATVGPGPGLTLSLAGATLHLPPRAGTPAPGAAVTLGIRPEHVVVVEEGGDCVARIDLVERLGGETFLYATAPGLPQLTVKRDGSAAGAPGDTLRLRLPPEVVHLFDEAGDRIPDR